MRVTAFITCGALYLTVLLFATAALPQAPDASGQADAPPEAAGEPQGGAGGDIEEEAEAAAAPVLPQATPALGLPAAIRPSITTKIDRKRIGLGETVNLEIAVRHKPDQPFHLPQNVGFGQLSLVSKASETRKEKGWVTDTYRFTLIALELGYLEVPPLALAAVTPAGEILSLESGRVVIQVTDPTSGQVSPRIKDVAPVVKVYEKNYILLYGLGIALGVLAVIALVWYLARNWERWHPKAPLAPPPPRPPQEVAWEKLKVLREHPPMDNETKKRWYIDLSEVMREYLANRFDFDALESTSEEIIEAMKMRKTVGITQAELWKFLVGCDMVKFARYKPGGEEDREMMDEAMRIVEVTTARQGM
jgi:hypothetical protein